MFPTVNGPAMQLQVQMTVGGGPAGASVQLAGFNAGFLGFTQPFVAGVVVLPNGNLLQGAFEVAMSSTRTEVQQLDPGAQPQQFSQAFSFDCSNVVRVALPLARTDRALSVSLNIVRRLQLEKNILKLFETRTLLLKKIVEGAKTDLIDDDYAPVFKLGDSLKTAQKNLDVASAKLFPRIKSGATRQAFLKAQRREDSDAAAALAGIRQIIAPAG